MVKFVVFGRRSKHDLMVICRQNAFEVCTDLRLHFGGKNILSRVGSDLFNLSHFDVIKLVNFFSGVVVFCTDCSSCLKIVDR